MVVVVMVIEVVMCLAVIVGDAGVGYQDRSPQQSRPEWRATISYLQI